MQTLNWLLVIGGTLIIVILAWRLWKQGTKRNSWKILLVDDDQTFVKLVQRHLLNGSFEIVTAETGEKGLALAKTENPDVILLDIILPGLKGREVCDKLKEDGRTRDIPVIFLTHKDSPDDVKAAMREGAVAYLTKPINFKELSATINKILGS